MSVQDLVVPVVPCNDINVSLAFYELLGFEPRGGDVYPDYAVLTNEKGAQVHLTSAPEGWLIPGKSPFGIYVYTDAVEELARRLAGRLLHPPKTQPWG
ncbi:MAG: glyoxalase, partial [Burkholderiales bacterium]